MLQITYQLLFWKDFENIIFIIIRNRIFQIADTNKMKNKTNVYLLYMKKKIEKKNVYSYTE